MPPRKSKRYNRKRRPTTPDGLDRPDKKTPNQQKKEILDDTKKDLKKINDSLSPSFTADKHANELVLFSIFASIASSAASNIEELREKKALLNKEAKTIEDKNKKAYLNFRKEFKFIQILQAKEQLMPDLKDSQKKEIANLKSKTTSKLDEIAKEFKFQVKDKLIEFSSAAKFLDFIDKSELNNLSSYYRNPIMDSKELNTIKDTPIKELENLAILSSDTPSEEECEMNSSLVSKEAEKMEALEKAANSQTQKVTM